MIRPVVSEGFLSTCGPRGCSALVGVFEADDVVNVNEVTGFVGVEAYEGFGFIATVVEVAAVVVVCKDSAIVPIAIEAVRVRNRVFIRQHGHLLLFSQCFLELYKTRLGAPA